MSATKLSEIANQKMQQIHSLVISFQALENDLRDTFQEIERKHQFEKKQLQQEINKLKGVDSTEISDNKLFGAVQLKNNPLSSQQHSNLAAKTSPSPRHSTPTTNDTHLHQSQTKMQYAHSNGYAPNNQPRNPNSSMSAKYQQQPQQVQPQQSNHYHSRSPLSAYSSYQQQQQPNHNHYNNGYNNNNHAQKSRSHGNGMVPPPPSSKPYGDEKKQLPPSPIDPKKKKINLLPDPPKQADKPKQNIFNKFLNKNNNQNSVLNDLGSGISERDFYKKYWIEAGKIGEGAFARVRKITRKSDKAVFALKMIKKKGKSNEDIMALQREILVLQKCDHENVVRLGDWCDTKKRIYMVVEFCDGGDVFERVVQYKKFSEKSAIHVVKQVASGLEHIHSLKYVHRDLKPDNLMYLTKAVDSKIKIIDFGLAGDCTKGLCKTPCGTAHYAAPEVLSSQEYDMSADMWSLGVIIYTLLCGFPPFFDASNNMKNLYHLIKKGQYSFPSPFWDDISNDAKDLIKKLLVKEPKQRLSSIQVLQHPWIVNTAANEKDLGNKYVKQMSHWQSTRQATEFGLGQEAPPPPPPDKPIQIFYDKNNQNQKK